MRGMTRFLLAACGAATLGCASGTSSVRSDEVPPAPPDDPYWNWPAPPVVSLAEMQHLDRTRVDVRSAKGAGAGTTGAQKVDVFVPEFDEDAKLKVKRMPGSLDGWNNAPRKEIAAYRIQELFLEPVDYVVPTTAPRCIPVEYWSEHHGSSSPQLPDTSCVLAVVAYWMLNVELPAPLYDEERFRTDGRYAYHLANFNVLTHLVDHHDNRSGNFLVSKNDAERRIFAIDNGTTFGPWFFNWFWPPSFAWQNIRVPALPEATVERLRALRREDLDYLLVLAQLEADDAGVLRLVDPDPPYDPSKGVSVRGTTVQFGLTAGELDDVWERIQDLLKEVDEGDLETL